MVTYGELFQYTLVIIGVIGLFIAANKKRAQLRADPFSRKKNPPGLAARGILP